MNANSDFTTYETSLSFPSSGYMVSPVRNFIGEIIENYGFQKLRTKIELCTEEILSNIIEHAYRNDPNFTIDLKVIVSTRMVELSFHEKGIPFDPSAIKPFDFNTLKGGLGTTIVKSLSDKYEFINMGREGKMIIISFFNQQTEIPLELKENEEQKLPIIVDPNEITFGRLKEEDAIQLSRLAWLNYGYSYEDFIYYPDEVKTKLQNKTIIAFAAWHNQMLIGHVALKINPQNSDFPEMGIALVSPEYRRNNIFSQLDLLAADYLSENSHSGYFVRAVTNHIASQKTATNLLKMEPINILICALPENVGMKDLVSLKDKLSAITLVKILKPITRTIFLPNKYHKLIEEIYSWSGVQINESEQQPYLLEEQNIFTVSLSKDLNSAFISFEQIGYDFESVIKSQLNEITAEGFPVIFLYLNLSDPGLPLIIDTLNQSSFIFSGIQFGHFNQSDAIIFQHLMKIEVNFEAINIFSERGNYLLDQIQNEYNQLNIKS